MKTCHRCGKDVGGDGRVGRTEECPGCGADLHVCLNCRFFDPAAYNSCREPRAERVVEKDRSNFCDYFLYRDAAGAGDTRSAAARKRLDDLFRKE